MTFAIHAQTREAGHADAVREEGRIPAVLYGPEIEPVSISLEPQAFQKLYDEAGESTLIDFSIEGQGEPTKVLIQDVQYDSLKDTFIHVDFRQIKMGEEMQATVELTFVGEAPAVKALGGTLIRQRETIDVKCLPKDLVSHIDVDLSVLATFDDAINVKDIAFPAGVTPVEDEELLVAKVNAPLTEEQLAAMEESQVGDVDAVEVDGEKKEEGDAAPEEEKKDE